ncbi:MAG: hypothetical protein ACLFR1_02485 [Spirochaetia bacterium]
MKGLRFICVIILLSIMVFSCSDSPFGPGDDTTTDETSQLDISNVLLEIPSTFSSYQSTRSGDSAGEETVLDHVQYIYNPVRNTYNVIASRAIDVVDAYLDAVDANILSIPSTMDALEESGEISGPMEELDANGNSQTYYISKTDNTYQVIISSVFDTQDGERELRNTQIDFTKEEERIYGTVSVRTPVLLPEERVEYQIDFDTADPDYGQVIELTVTSLDNDSDNSSKTENIPTRLWLKAYQLENIFYIAGTVYYTDVIVEEDSPYQDIFMSELDPDGTWASGDAPISAGIYTYQGAADVSDPDATSGLVNLATVPFHYTGTDVFTQYSMGALYKRVIAEWIKSDTETDMNDTEEGVQTVLEIVNNALSAYESTISISDTSENDQVFSALQELYTFLDNDENQDPGDLGIIIAVTKITNPGYFGHDSFVGTEDLARPSWADDFSGLTLPDPMSAADIQADTFSVVFQGE